VAPLHTNLLMRVGRIIKWRMLADKDWVIKLVVVNSLLDEKNAGGGWTRTLLAVQDSNVVFGRRMLEVLNKTTNSSSPRRLLLTSKANSQQEAALQTPRPQSRPGKVRVGEQLCRACVRD
jgi:hypothetical protein